MAASPCRHYNIAVTRNASVTNPKGGATTVKINTIQDVHKFLEGQYITIADFATLAGIHRNSMYNMLHHRIPMTRLMRLRIQRAVDFLAANPPEVQPAPSTRETRMTILAGF
jgi:hypothetical protein